MSALRKNVASQVLNFQLVNATSGAALTGASVTVKVSLDGTQSGGAGTVTELGTGQYKYVPTQAETNGTSVGFGFTASNAVPVGFQCFTTRQDTTAATVDANITAITAGIIAAASFASGALDAVWSTATRALTDKAGFALSSAGVQAIWDALSSALTTVGSIGKRLVDDLTGDIYARLGAPAGASVSADVAAIKAVLPSALVSGRIDASVGAMAAGVLTATAIAADAITAAKVADGTIDAATFAAGAINAAAIAADAITDAKVAADVTIASVTGAVGSVTGAVGSVTGNVGGNVTGSVGSVTGNVGGNVTGSVGSVVGAVGSVTGNVGGNVTGSVGSMATGGISAASFAAGAIDAAAIATDAIGSNELAASAISEIQSGLSTLDAAGVRAAVGLASANLDTQLAAIDDFIDTEVAAIKAVTDQFTSAQGEPSSVPAANATPLQKIAWLAALARNKVAQTATAQTLKADDGSTTIATATVSDDGTTFTRAEWS